MRFEWSNLRFAVLDRKYGNGGFGAWYVASIVAYITRTKATLRVIGCGVSGIIPKGLRDPIFFFGTLPAANHDLGF
jgi:hypothetical protein